MWECPSCGNKTETGWICPVCGFDESKNYGKYPVVTPLTKEQSLYPGVSKGASADVRKSGGPEAAGKDSIPPKAVKDSIPPKPVKDSIPPKAESTKEGAVSGSDRKIHDSQEVRQKSSAGKKKAKWLLIPVVFALAGVFLRFSGILSDDTRYYNYIVLEDGTAEITGFTSGREETAIPEKIGGHVVSSLGDNAFDGCSHLKKITIPDTVTTMGANPFQECSQFGVTFEISSDHPSLELVDGALYSRNEKKLICCPRNKKTLEIPEGTKSIGDYAFAYCSHLNALRLPESITEIGAHAFFSCEKLFEISIPDSVTSIGDFAFSYCKNLDVFRIPDNLTDISATVFFKCDDLEFEISEDHPHLALIGNILYSSDRKRLLYVPRSEKAVSVPDGTEEIGDNAFSECSSLASVELPDTVKNIGAEAFYNCKSLRSITVPDGVTSLKERTFGFCENLSTVVLPASLTSIDEYAFSYCTVLREITIPESVTSIGDSAFSGCESLRKIVIPDSVTQIGKDAFLNCSALTISVTEGSYAAQYCEDHKLKYE